MTVPCSVGRAEGFSGGGHVNGETTLPMVVCQKQLLFFCYSLWQECQRWPNYGWQVVSVSLEKKRTLDLPHFAREINTLWLVEGFRTWMVWESFLLKEESNMFCFLINYKDKYTLLQKSCIAVAHPCNNPKQQPCTVHVFTKFPKGYEVV